MGELYHRYRDKGARADYMREYCRGYERQYRERRRAYQIVKRALLSGLLIRPELCEKCLKQLVLRAHHDDYSKPLDVIWLCETCHKGTLHKKKAGWTTGPH